MDFMCIGTTYNGELHGAMFGAPNAEEAIRLLFDRERDLNPHAPSYCYTLREQSIAEQRASKIVNRYIH